MSAFQAAKKTVVDIALATAPRTAARTRFVMSTAKTFADALSSAGVTVPPVLQSVPTVDVIVATTPADIARLEAQCDTVCQEGLSLSAEAAELEERAAPSCRTYTWDRLPVQIADKIKAVTEALFENMYDEFGRRLRGEHTLDFNPGGKPTQKCDAYVGTV